MKDLIDRQAAIDKTYELREHFKCWDRYDDFVIRKAYADIPAADVRENVRGEWEEVAERGLCDLRRCSNCGHIEPVGLEMITPKPNFCPNCGADMRGEEDERQDESV